MNRTDIYRQPIKRTFADLYGVSPDTVEVSWTSGEDSLKSRKLSWRPQKGEYAAQRHENSPRGNQPSFSILSDACFDRLLRR